MMIYLFIMKIQTQTMKSKNTAFVITLWISIAINIFLYILGISTENYLISLVALLSSLLCYMGIPKNED